MTTWNDDFLKNWRLEISQFFRNDDFLKKWWLENEHLLKKWRAEKKEFLKVKIGSHKSLFLVKVVKRFDMNYFIVQMTDWIQKVFRT